MDPRFDSLVKLRAAVCHSQSETKRKMTISSGFAIKSQRSSYRTASGSERDQHAIEIVVTSFLKPFRRSRVLIPLATARGSVTRSLRNFQT